MHRFRRRGNPPAWRALRLRPQDLQWEWPAADVLRLSFALPPGAYATTVLAEIGDVA